MKIVKPKTVSKGYTLIEVVITIALLAFVGLVVTTSSFFDVSGWLAHYRLNAATRDLQFNLQYAKMMAINTNCYCTVTFNQQVGNVTYDYVIYEDTDEDLEFDPSTDRLLKKISFANYEGVAFDTSMGGGDGLTFSNNDDNLPSIAFDPKGLPRNNTHGFGAGSAYLTDGKGHQTRVVVSSVGRIRTE